MPSNGRNQLTCPFGKGDEQFNTIDPPDKVTACGIAGIRPASAPKPAIPPGPPPAPPNPLSPGGKGPFPPANAAKPPNPLLAP